MKFRNKVVIVTGGGQGIGKCISMTFAREGAYVIIADIDSVAGLETQNEINNEGFTSHFINTDVSKENNVSKMVSEVLSRNSKIDILINNAGISSFEGIFDSSLEHWNRVLETNLTGTYLCSKYCAEAMSSKGGGCIINIASTRAFMSEPDTEAYSASKGGIIALTHSMGVSLGKHKIRVNSISPGWIETSTWQKSADSKPSFLREIDHLQHPAGRVGTPYDIASACIFLCSNDASFITGTNLTVDGGMTIKMIYEE